MYLKDIANHSLAMFVELVVIETGDSLPLWAIQMLLDWYTDVADAWTDTSDWSCMISSCP